MKIGLDIRSLQESQGGGVFEYTYNLLKKLFQIDGQNKYYLLANSFCEISPLWAEILDFKSVTLKRFRFPNKLFNSFVLLFKQPRLDKMLGGVDLFFAPNLNFISLSRNCRRVITVHDLSFRYFPEFFSAKSRIWHRLVNPEKIYQTADLLIAVSQKTKEDLVNSYGIDPVKIEVIYSGIDPSFYQRFSSQEIESVKRKYRLPSHFILSVSGLEPRKNLESLIGAYLELKKEMKIKQELVLVGSFHGADRNFKRKIKSLSKGGVRFIGYIDRFERPLLYQLADVFVYPSYYEGFGFPPLESLAAGTPVIASTYSSLPEITGEAALLVDPYNKSEIKNALKKIILDQDLRRNLVNKGFDLCKKYTWEKTAERTLEVFRKVV